jgi:hypothetical protein
MMFPIKIPWDLSTKVRIVITHMTITDRDISNEAVNPIPVEMVNCELVAAYPLAEPLMEIVMDFARSHPGGIKLYDCTGRKILNFKTGEIYPVDGD